MFHSEKIAVREVVQASQKTAEKISALLEEVEPLVGSAAVCSIYHMLKHQHGSKFVELSAVVGNLYDAFLENGLAK